MLSKPNEIKIPKTGIPHFKGTFKKARASDYSFEKAILDIFDNIIFKCNNIKIFLSFNNDKIHNIKISDDYNNGFENINEENESNPFNMAHVKEGHSDDKETSEFGMGFKLASIFLGNKLSVFTRVENIFYQVEFNFDKMCNESDPNDSYEPSKYRSISKEIYRENHPFENGSSIIIDKLEPENYSLNNKENTISEIQKWISNAYT